jgi:hypothetical protein
MDNNFKTNVENKSTRNDLNNKFSSYLIDSFVEDSFCLPNSSQFQKDRNTGIKSNLINIESQLSGRGTPSGKGPQFGLRDSPQNIPLDICKDETINRYDRETKVRGNLSEKDRTSHTFQILPYDSTKNYRSFDYVNSRQQYKDSLL